MNTVFSKQIQKLWKQKGITQEQLAVHLGVSAQAVSKWENGSYPDGDLLPVIADFFGVSIDSLYGRGEQSQSFEQQTVSHFHSVIESNINSTKEWIDSLQDLLWAAQLTSWIECKSYYPIPDFKNATGTYSTQFFCNEGITYMRLNSDYRFFTFLKEPEEGYTKIFSDIDKLTELFGFLSDKVNLKVLMYLMSLNLGEVSSAATISELLGYPKEKIETALKYLLKINGPNLLISDYSVITPDNKTEKVYGLRGLTPEALILLTGAYAMLNQPCGYQNSVNIRDFPLFNKKDLSFIKWRNNEKEEK